MAAIREKIDELGCDNVLAVHSTISCFAPRQPDLIPQVSELCFDFAIPHIVNGAYCLQIPRAVNLINNSVGQKQRLDCVVFSTDKNFMTPVGGSVIVTPTKAGFKEPSPNNRIFLIAISAIHNEQ